MISRIRTVSPLPPCWKDRMQVYRLLCPDHQPHSLDESVKNQVDLHLSGHTHNGQIFPFNRFVSRIYGLGYGYRKSGNTHQYVSSGLGLWAAPIRLGTQSEIVKIYFNLFPLRNRGKHAGHHGHERLVRNRTLKSVASLRLMQFEKNSLSPVRFHTAET